jgi:hypothetical protein
MDSTHSHRKKSLDLTDCLPEEEGKSDTQDRPRTGTIARRRPFAEYIYIEMSPGARDILKPAYTKMKWIEWDVRWLFLPVYINRTAFFDLRSRSTQV